MRAVVTLILVGLCSQAADSKHTYDPMTSWVMEMPEPAAKAAAKTGFLSRADGPSKKQLLETVAGSAAVMGYFLLRDLHLRMKAPALPATSIVASQMRRSFPNDRLVESAVAAVILALVVAGRRGLRRLRRPQAKTARVQMKMTAMPCSHEAEDLEMTRTPSSESEVALPGGTQRRRGMAPLSLGSPPASPSSLALRSPGWFDFERLPHTVEEPDITGFGRPGYVRKRTTEIELRDSPTAQQRGRPLQRIYLRLTPSNSPERCFADDMELPLQVSFHRIGTEMAESEGAEDREAELEDAFFPDSLPEEVPYPGYGWW